MEVKMTPVKRSDLPGMKPERPHDDWAKAAIVEFLESGEEAVELDVPAFKVQYHTVKNLLIKYSKGHGVKVKSVRADTRTLHRTFLYKEA